MLLLVSYFVFRLIWSCLVRLPPLTQSWMVRVRILYSCVFHKLIISAGSRKIIAATPILTVFHPVKSGLGFVILSHRHPAALPAPQTAELSVIINRQMLEIGSVIKSCQLKSTQPALRTSTMPLEA